MVIETFESIQVKSYLFNKKNHNQTVVTKTKENVNKKLETNLEMFGIEN